MCLTFWNHLTTKSSAVLPAVVFGGDFNNSPLEWRLCFTELMETQSSRLTVQMRKSRPTGGHKGDNAIAINVRAIAETSGFGVSWMNKKDAFTDERDVVLVPLHYGRVITERSTALQDSSNSQN